MHISVIGGGPRGLSVIEALAFLMENHPPSKSVNIKLFDTHAPGAGRIWRPDQQECLLMNTLAGQVTMFSQGIATKENARAGYGPSLKDWLNPQRPDTPDFYAKRRDYGRYLEFVFERLRSSIPTPHRLSAQRAAVLDICKLAGRYRLSLTDETVFWSDAILLCTGHASSTTSALSHMIEIPKISDCRLIAGDSCADLDLAPITPESSVGIVGMGLGFLDIMASLTEGRGGHFIESSVGLRYQPSGREPKIIAGSRSGLPIPPRARNQKNGWCFKPKFFTRQNINQLREKLCTSDLDFDNDVWPLIVAEMEGTYYTALIHNTYGSSAADAFNTAHVGQRDPWHGLPPALVAEFALDEFEPFNIAALKEPFAGRQFSSEEEFQSECIAYLKHEIAKARQGNLTNAEKQTLDIIREIRDELRDLVEFSGLSENSLVDEFLNTFAPIGSQLAAGPPIERVEQVNALIEANILSVIGPNMRLEHDPKTDQISMFSPMVTDKKHYVKHLVDSRTPFPGLAETANPLLVRLRDAGFIAPWSHKGGGGRIQGGVDIDRQSFRLRDASGQLHDMAFALGIPTEGPKWFTQVGSATPGKFSNFSREASIIAGRIHAACLSNRQEDIA